MKREGYHRYYDKIFAQKNYRNEAGIILKEIKRRTGVSRGRLLDIGCGTGTHDFFFAERGWEVRGIDTDRGAIEVARAKARNWKGSIKPRFSAIPVEKVRGEAPFELITSLFNVVNYIPDSKRLLSFFSSAESLLNKNGMFVFDAWNGVAALLDPPRQETKRIAVDGEEIVAHTVPTLDFFDQSVFMDNKIAVKARGEKTKRFSFSYTSFLWTPWQVKGLLELAGFNAVAVTPWMQPSKRASERNWKIMYLCQKR